MNAAPDNEADVDGDGYIECDNDGSEWKGAEPPTGYSDCEDTVDTIFSREMQKYVTVVLTTVLTLSKVHLKELYQIVSVQMIVK